jgi:hypothetical protein
MSPIETLASQLSFFIDSAVSSCGPLPSELSGANDLSGAISTLISS